MKPLLVATSIALASLAANAQCLPTQAHAHPPAPTGLLRTAFAPPAATALHTPASTQEGAASAPEPQGPLLLTGLALMAGIALRRRGW